MFFKDSGTDLLYGNFYETMEISPHTGIINYVKIGPRAPLLAVLWGL